MSLRTSAPRRARADVVGTLRRNPGFRRIYLAQLISYAGDWFNVVALLGLIAELTHSSLLAGLLFATLVVPSAIFSPFAGVVVDRVDRRLVMIAADIGRAGLALGILLVHSKETLWIAFACEGAIAILTSFFEPASSAALPNLVSEEDLPTANVLMGSSWGTMLAVGAALGGVVAVVLGRRAAFIGDSVSFVLSAMLIARVHARFHAEHPRDRARTAFRSDLVELFTFARTEARIRSLLLVKAGFGLTAGAISLISVMADEIFHAGDRGTGLLFSARGLGAVAGPFLFRALFARTERGIFAGIATAFLVFGLGYGILGVAPSLAVATVGVCIAHVGGAAQWTLSTFGLQRYSPDRIRGRVFGADFALTSLTMGISFVLAGWVASVFGARAVTVGLAAAAAAWSAAWTLATRSSWPESPPRRASTLAP